MQSIKEFLQKVTACAGETTLDLPQAPLLQQHQLVLSGTAVKCAVCQQERPLCVPNPGNRAFACLAHVAQLCTLIGVARWTTPKSFACTAVNGAVLNRSQKSSLTLHSARA